MEPARPAYVRYIAQGDAGAQSRCEAVVWAHNSHIGNAAATAMGWQGEFNIGELARTAFGNDVIAIGFGTDHGRVAAASSWDQPMRIMNVYSCAQRQLRGFVS